MQQKRNNEGDNTLIMEFVYAETEISNIQKSILDGSPYDGGEEEITDIEVKWRILELWTLLKGRIADTLGMTIEEAHRAGAKIYRKKLIQAYNGADAETKNRIFQVLRL